MVKLIDGKKLAEIEKDRIIKEIIALNGGDKNCPKRPNLAIILVGERADSRLYVEMKEREAKLVGIDTHIYRCPEQTPEREIFDMIAFLNQDDNIDAILVQLPLPAGYDTDGIILAIDPKKDVDRFHPDNLAEFFRSCDHAHVQPPLVKTVLKILESIDCEIKGKRAAIIANSEIFGRTLAKALECLGAACHVLGTHYNILKSVCSQADILITAVGKKGLVTKELVKPDAIVIDIGIVKEGMKVYGDVDYESVKDQAAYLTPVPGGVGPLTIAMLFANTLDLYKQRRAS